MKYKVYKRIVRIVLICCIKFATTIAEMQILLCKNSLHTVANIRETQLQMKEIVLNYYKSLTESVMCRRKEKNISFNGGH